ncbi:MAG: HYR domain-containing protein [Saprospiraceae bacterium]|nr:MAG: HYR domain-containing protein [Saprospiraceae bacterium]
MKRLLLSSLAALLISFAAPLPAQDITPPVITCPAPININLSPGACDAVVSFNVTATDNASVPSITQIDNTGLTSGDNFPIGSYLLTFQAQDASANADTCSFTITVNGFNPPSIGLVCDDLLNVSMPATCEMWITPGMVLEGDYGCFGNFVVNVANSDTNYIDYSYVGQTVNYTVVNTVTGMSCWGLLKIEDKVGPWIRNCDSVTINCLQDVNPDTIGGDVPTPWFVDCHSFDVLWVDMVTQGTCADTFSTRIMRIWNATDSIGNQSTCTQFIEVKRISLVNLVPVCPPDTTLLCVAGFIPDVSPAVTGYPTLTVNSITYDITPAAGSLCNITSSYQDQVIPSCGASYRILRTWTVIDWCLPINMITNPWICKQIINVEDKTAPLVTAPADITLSANLPGCHGTPILPPATVADCSSFTVLVLTPVGPIAGNGGQVPFPGLAIGTHKIIYKVTDACGNSASDTMKITLVDNVKPHPVCDAHTVVALDDQGYGITYAATFDDGSSDNCCIDHFEVAKLNDYCGNNANYTFGPSIDYCCADAAHTIYVILRVFDCHGNYNECTVQVQVQDASSPTLTCPPNLTVTCGTDITDLNITGDIATNPALQGPNDGLATDNCGSVLTIIHADDGNLPCGTGTLFRTFKVTDAGGASAYCVQVITIQPVPNIGNLIVFPADITVSGCDALTNPAITGEPVVPPTSGCNMLATTHTDLVFDNVQGACKKILRTWTVVDWCPNSAAGPWQHTQTIMVNDLNTPWVPICENRTFCNFKPNCSDFSPDLSVVATDDCTPENLLLYSWQVDLYNNGSYDASGFGQNLYNFYPIGTHHIRYAIVDHCGNTGYCDYLFTIEDCKKPTVVCETGVIVEMMQGGTVDLNAQTLDAGSSDNCTTGANLLFSFTPNPADSVITLTCNDLGSLPVQLWVTDSDNNQDFCETQILVQDNMGACQGPLIALAGTVANEEQEGVQEVTIELNGNSTGTTLTNAQGAYQFDNLPLGYDYTLTPNLNDNPLNGVTTYDLVLLHRHILNIEPLQSPYKLIAGDINNNAALSVSDVVDMRKVILYILPEFPNNTSWRFVDGAYVFPDPNDPFNPPFPEVNNINNLTSTGSEPDFVAVKIGDLNSSAIANGLLSGTDDRNSGEGLTLMAQDRMVKAGEKVTVDFSASLKDVAGYQFTLNFDTKALQLDKLTTGPQVEESNFGMALLEQGAITASWDQLAATHSDAVQLLFSLTFTASQDALLSNSLTLNSRFTKAESYNNDGEVHAVNLRFDGPDGMIQSTTNFELYQNVPNPFSESTSIGFNLPEASTATLSVFDVAGKLVKSMSGNFGKGYQEFSIAKGDLPNRGVFYYRLETPTNTATRKMTQL